MLFIDFVSWWYGTGWADRFAQMRQRLAYWWQYFSITTLLKTLFSPWRQIVTDKTQDRSFDQMMKALVDNTVSRFVGFWVRVFVIIAGILGMSLLASLNLAYVIAWPVIPLIPLVLIAMGVDR